MLHSLIKDRDHQFTDFDVWNTLALASIAGQESACGIRLGNWIKHEYSTHANERRHTVACYCFVVAFCADRKSAPKKRARGCWVSSQVSCNHSVHTMDIHACLLHVHRSISTRSLAICSHIFELWVRKVGSFSERHKTWPVQQVSETCVEIFWVLSWRSSTKIINLPTNCTEEYHSLLKTVVYLTWSEPITKMSTVATFRYIRYALVIKEGPFTFQYARTVLQHAFLYFAPKELWVVGFCFDHCWKPHNVIRCIEFWVHLHVICSSNQPGTGHGIQTRSVQHGTRTMRKCRHADGASLDCSGQTSDHL